MKEAECIWRATTHRQAQLLQLLLLIALPVSQCRSALAAKTPDDWPMPRHDSRNTGYSRERIAPPLHLLWRAPAFASRPTEAVLLSSDGAVAVLAKPPGGQGIPGAAVYNLEGKPVWQLKNAVPIYLKGRRLIVARDEGHTTTLECHDWRRRIEIWNTPLGEQVQDRQEWGAVERRGRLYWAGNFAKWNDHDQRPGPARSNLKVFDVANGRLIVETDSKKLGGQDSGWGTGPPAVDDRYVTWGVSHWLFRLDPKQLDEAAKFRYDGGNAYVISAGGLIIAKGWLDYIQAWNIRTNRLVWKTGAPREVAHALLPGRNGRLIVVESSTGLDLKTGKTTVQYLVGKTPVYANSVAGSGNLVYMAGIGGFYCFEAATGRFLWKYDKPGLEGFAVIVSVGRVYGLGSDGYLYAFGRPSHSPGVRAGK